MLDVPYFGKIYKFETTKVKYEASHVAAKGGDIFCQAFMNKTLKRPMKYLLDISVETFTIVAQETNKYNNTC